MRNLKKFLALVLAMIMAMSLMITADAKVVNSTGFADEKTYAQTGNAGYAEFDEAIAVLTGMGVIKGDKSGADGATQFRPTENLTRAEAAALIYRVLTGDVNDNQAKLFVDVQTNLTDVTPDKWYAGYVGYLWNAKIIKGRAAGDAYVFDASAKVTGYEVLTMMLRAIGWGRNGEFEGATWQITASSTAKVEGVLNLISNTAFESTLWQPARRDVTAAIIFSGLTDAVMVDYIAPGQYSKTSMIQGGFGGIASTTANPTLGQYRFGLDSMEGIIVGNKETREDRTLLSREVSFLYDGSSAIVKAPWVSGVSYEHETTNAANGNAAAATASTTQKGVAVTQFDLGTGLNLFGHKVRMWYDNGSGTGTSIVEDGSTPVNSLSFTSRYTKGYVAYDLAVMDEVIFADDVSLTSGGVNPTVYNGAVNEGFAGNATVYESDRYGRLVKDNDNMVDSESEVGLYRVIANGSDKKFNVVIALNQEVATITQVNTTDRTNYGNHNYIVLGNGGSSQNANFGTAGSDFGHQDWLNSSVRGVVIDDQLVGAINIEKAKEFVNSDKPVIATEIVGTKAAVPASGDPDDYVYSIEELKPAFTGTIASYVMNASNNLIGVMTLSSTERYSLSGITGSGGNDWHFAGSTDGANYSHLVNGLTPLTGANNVNIAYTFYTDAAGRVIGVKVPNDYGFIYATFADYEIGALGTGTSGYYVYGVDWNGEKVLDRKLSTINLPINKTGSNAGGPIFDDTNNNTDGSNATDGNFCFTQYNFPGTDGTLGDGYSLLPITMKNQGSPQILSSNQIQEGGNTRFLLDSEGNLDWFNNGSGQYGRRFNGWFSDVTNNPSYTWTITATDAANGFLRVYNQEFGLGDQGTDRTSITTSTDNIGYVLTNNTKFHVVTGSGTADLNVTSFTGLNGLLNGDSGVEITLDATLDNVYFLTSEDRYGNADTSANRTIDTVILSDSNLKRFTSKNVYFSAPGNGAINNSTLVGGNPNIVLYELYTNGVPGSYWIDTTRSIDGTGTPGNGPDGLDQYGSFYTLAKIDTINGTPVYRATAVAQDGQYNKTTTGCFTGNGNSIPVEASGANVYHYVAVNELNTAEIGTKVFNVTGATVTEAFGTNTPADTTTIDSLQALNWAVAKFETTGVTTNQFTIQVAFVYDGIRVSNIYVTDITAN